MQSLELKEEETPDIVFPENHKVMESNEEQKDCQNISSSNSPTKLAKNIVKLNINENHNNIDMMDIDVEDDNNDNNNNNNNNNNHDHNDNNNKLVLEQKQQKNESKEITESKVVSSEKKDDKDMNDTNNNNNINNNNNNNQKDEDDDNDDNDESDSECDESEDDPMSGFLDGLSEEQKKIIMARMNSIQSGFKKLIDDENKEVMNRCNIEFEQQITEDEAEFMINFCKNNNINLETELNVEFIESMKEMMKEMIIEKEKKEKEEKEKEKESINNNNNNNNPEWVQNAINRKKEHDLKRQKLGLSKNQNMDGSERCQRLLLNEALEKAKNNNFEGWSIARLKAWKSKDQNPNSYYYRFNDPGQDQKNGKFSAEEHKLFMERVLEIGVNLQWGVFSQKINGRVGYQCSNYWRQLIKEGCISDPNYSIDPNNKSKLHFKRGLSHKENENFKRYAFVVIKDPSKTFKNLPARHPKCPSDQVLNEINANNNNQNNQIQNNNNNNNSNNKKRKRSTRKRKRKSVNYDDDDDEDDSDFYIPPTSKKRKYNNNLVNDEINNNINEDLNNPIPDFIDMMTGIKILKPAISPHGHVLGYDTWTKILRKQTGSNKNKCPFTGKKLTRRSLIKLTIDNYQMYKDKIVNITNNDIANMNNLN